MIEFINHIPLLGLMLVTALGYSLGRLSVRKLSLGPAGGTLFVALALGYCGVSLDGFYGSGSRTLTIGTLGFVLFIYSVGFEAGPRFFSSLSSRDGWKFVSVAVFANVVAVIVATLWGRLLSLDAGTVAGMLAGALTSAPTYAAASQMNLDSAHLSVAFAITYPLGLVGLVVMIQIIPRRLQQNLSLGALNDSEFGLDRSALRPGNHKLEASRIYAVTREEALGVPLRDLRLTRRTGCVLSRVMRGHQVLIPDANTELQVDDHVMATGRVEELHQLEQLIGAEIQDIELEDKLPPARRILVLHSDTFGKSLAELKLIDRFHCIITGIERGSEELEPGADVSLQRNDIVEAMGTRDDVRRLARELGDFEPATDETNIAIYTGGIFLGLLIGSLHLGVLGLDYHLGVAPGLLLAGLVLGWRGRIGSYSTHVPRSARQLVRDLGILLFIGETGLQAGGRLMEGLTLAPILNLAGAALVTVVTVLGSLFFGLKLLKLRPLDCWGSVCGGLTSSAALQTLRKTTDSNEVTVSYAAAYAVGSVLATIAGQVIVALVP